MIWAWWWVACHRRIHLIAFDAPGSVVVVDPGHLVARCRSRPSARFSIAWPSSSSLPVCHTCFEWLLTDAEIDARPLSQNEQSQ